MSLDANSSMPGAASRTESATRSARSCRDDDHARGVGAAVASFADRILRRGPLEAIATAIIAAGVVMLMQPFFADALFLVVRDHAVRHSDVHHCLEGQGVGRMAQIRVEALDKSFGEFPCRQGSQLHGGGRRVPLPAGSFRLRQDDDAAHDCRTGTADGRHHSARRRGRHDEPRIGARYRFRVPAVRPLSAHECPAKHRFPPEMRGHRRGGSPTGGWWRPRASCAFRIFSTGRCRVLPAAIGSASRSGGRSCASRNAS